VRGDGCLGFDAWTVQVVSLFVTTSSPGLQTEETGGAKCWTYVELFLHGVVHSTAYEQPHLIFRTTNLDMLFIHCALFVPFAA